MADIKQFKAELKDARTHANRSPNKFLSSDVHDILADWLEDKDDPRQVLVRKRIKRSQADYQARQATDSRFLGPWQPMRFKFLDGSNLIVIVHGGRGKILNPTFKHNDPTWDDHRIHVRWEALPRVFYDAVMTKEEFQNWIRSFSEEQKKLLLTYFQNNPQTAKYDESKKFDSFEQFLKTEMAGTGAIYDGTKSPDFQWQGAPQSMIRSKKKKK